MANQPRDVSRDAAVLRVTHAYLRDCFRARTTPRVNELAACLRLTRTQVTRAIHRITGMTAAAYLKHRQLVRFRALLLRGMPIKEIAAHAGFNTSKTLRRCVKRLTGRTPRDFRTK